MNLVDIFSGGEDVWSALLFRKPAGGSVEAGLEEAAELARRQLKWSRKLMLRPTQRSWRGKEGPMTGGEDLEYLWFLPE